MSIPHESLTCSIHHTVRFEKRRRVLLKPLERSRNVKSSGVVETADGKHVDEHFHEHSVVPDLLLGQMKSGFLVRKNLGILDSPDVVIVDLSDKRCFRDND